MKGIVMELEPSQVVLLKISHREPTVRQRIMGNYAGCKDFTGLKNYLEIQLRDDVTVVAMFYGTQLQLINKFQHIFTKYMFEQLVQEVGSAPDDVKRIALQKLYNTICKQVNERS